MTQQQTRRKIVIMGAGGRDFHNFNTVYRDDDQVQVVAFTATQIPGIAGRRYPPSLAGTLYPDGIPIVPEEDLESLCGRERVDEVVFAYSDVTHQTVMQGASRVLAAGADFVLLGPRRTMLSSRLPVIAVCAVRTGCGKSQTSRYLCELLRARGLRPGVLRHPMPYGDLERQVAQRFAAPEDLDKADCTIEEREEYEPYIEEGAVVFAGVDYAQVLEQAEVEADIILWDGGNNDFPFVRPDLLIVLTDGLRPGHETGFHPGETALRMADLVIINKVDASDPDDVARIESAIAAVNPAARVITAASPISLDTGETLQGKRVLVVEDGPTVTHGGMAFGAGYVAAQAAGAEIVDPRPYAEPEISDVFEKYSHLGDVLPALGYGAEQLDALTRTIDNAQVDLVVAGTPIDLARLVEIDKPVIRARYAFSDAGEPTLAQELDAFLADMRTGQP